MLPLLCNQCIPALLTHTCRDEAQCCLSSCGFGRVLDEAFLDLRGLMTKAQEMVQLAEKFRETLASKGGEAETLDPEMQRQLIDMGIASPVTKDTAGAKYHQQLSRQVAICGSQASSSSVAALHLLLHGGYPLSTVGSSFYPRGWAMLFY